MDIWVQLYNRKYRYYVEIDGAQQRNNGRALKNATYEKCPCAEPAAIWIS